MLMKVLAAVLVLVVALIAVRHITMRVDEARLRARARAKPAPAPRRNTITLRQDPKTGVYHTDE